ncbi:TetR/AcrR family transcriptional regulator [uncultured Flavonifractor sp.]|uniref:TetR/AcrR family transcriptional regulator n=1 Tax=uncultured Flavonifractor sp. TaxID=1193534 RepID=UPI002631027C|nr:TetR/AcrR family transcriptional regulator [uncultured Flavonifractor sp.]
MPPKEKTPAEKAAEKARILDAALDILACDGYEGLTMRKLGQKIGASATKIYLYFVNKDEVYLSVVIEGYRQLCASLRQAVEAARGGEARLDAFLRTYLEFAWSHPAFYEVMALQKIPMQADYAGTPMEAAARQKYEAGMEVFLLTRKVLEDYLKEKGYTPPVSRDAAAFSVIVFLNGLLNTYYNKLAHTVFSDLEQLLDNCIILLKNSFRSG